MADTDPAPMTEAGRHLLSAHKELFGDDVRLDVNARILAIEAEARGLDVERTVWNIDADGVQRSHEWWDGYRAALARQGPPRG